MEHKFIPITVDGISLDIAAVYRKASEDLVFFVHGLGCAKESFDDVWHQAGFQDLSLLSIDLPGFGASARPDQFSYTMEDHARVCEAVLRGFAYDRLHIVAHSMGGAVGLLLPDDTLNKTVSFSNIEGNLVGEDCGLISREVSRVSFEVFENELFPKYRMMFHGIEIKGLSLDKAHARAFYRSAASLVVWSESGNLLERYKALRCRKVYFYGDQNSGLKVLKKLSGLKTQAISGSGHFVMDDNPNEFYSNLLKFLKR